MIRKTQGRGAEQRRPEERRGGGRGGGEMPPVTIEENGGNPSQESQRRTVRQNSTLNSRCGFAQFAPFSSYNQFAKCPAGRTALHRAKSVEILTVLIEHDADPTLLDRLRRSALMLCVISRSPAEMEFLLRYPRLETLLTCKTAMVKHVFISPLENGGETIQLPP